MINWLLRQGLTEQVQLALSFRHEVGHFESLPLVVLYIVLNMIAIIVSGPVNMVKIIILFISAHATWEMLAELYTVLSDVPYYGQCYNRISKLPRLVFWISAAVLTSAGWFIVIA